MSTPVNLASVSSDDVISSYREQLADAHHQIAVLTAQLSKAIQIMRQDQQNELAMQTGDRGETDGRNTGTAQRLDAQSDG
jgi:hypothetical protein